MSNTTTDHPLGTPAAAHEQTAAEKSIIDTVLDLDSLLSADVRRGTTIARFSVRPDLQAELEQLDHQLASMVDANGRILVAVDDDATDLGVGDDRSVGDATPAGEVDELLQRYQQLQDEFGGTFRTVLFEQMPADEWEDFENRHKAAISKGHPYPRAMWEEVITRCAIRPTFTVEQLRALRKKLGAPALAELERKAWQVNTEAGVSIPKSRSFSDVQKQQRRGRS